MNAPREMPGTFPWLHAQPSEEALEQQLRDILERPWVQAGVTRAHRTVSVVTQG